MKFSTETKISGSLSLIIQIAIKTFG